MTWLRLDDSFPDHPKVIGLSDKAFRLHISALCYCTKHLTNGSFSKQIANKLAIQNAQRTIQILLNLGLWIRTETGYEIHDFLKHQTSKEQAEQEKETNRLRAAKARKAKAERARHGVTHGERSGGVTVTNTHTPTPTPTHIYKEREKEKITTSKAYLGQSEFLDLSNLLADKIQANGSKRPNVSKAFVLEIERMQRLDGHTLNEIQEMILWSQQDNFWKSNILSSTKLRARFDQMRLKKQGLGTNPSFEISIPTRVPEPFSREEAELQNARKTPMPENFREIFARGKTA